MGALSKYYRTKKLSIKLPSRCRWYPEDFIDNPDKIIDVMGMTSIDEMEMENPDALMSGEASLSVIRSCCPSIKDPSLLKTIDYKAIMLAIKTATYGMKEKMQFKCPQCEKDTEVEIDNLQILENVDYCDEEYTVTLDDGLKFYLRPSSIKVSDKLSKEEFQYERLIRVLQEFNDKPVEEREKVEEKIKKEIDNLVKNLSIDLLELISDSIDYVVTPDNEKISDEKEIKDFIFQLSQKNIDIFREEVTKLNSKGIPPSIKVACPECQKIIELTGFDFDPVNFFD